MIKICLFFNGQRGLNILSYLKKKNFLIKDIFLSKKFLNKEILSNLNNYYIINKVNSKKVKKALIASDIAIVAGFPYIFSKKLFSMPKFGIINCHAGFLPKYRGGSPLNWQIINGEKKFGITTLKMNKKIDGGEIINEKKFPLKKNYDINDLHKIVNKNFPKLIIKSIKKLISGKKLKKQINTSSYFNQRDERDSLIRFEQLSYLQIKNHLRALKKPYPEAFFFYDNKKIIIKDILKIKKKKLPKKILKKQDNYYVKCKDCRIKIIT